jgi:hypothetical protein
MDTAKYIAAVDAIKGLTANEVVQVIINVATPEDVATIANELDKFADK